MELAGDEVGKGVKAAKALQDLASDQNALDTAENQGDSKITQSMTYFLVWLNLLALTSSMVLNAEKLASLLKLTQRSQLETNRVFIKVREY
jgi:hypothetical protein